MNCEDCKFFHKKGWLTVEQELCGHPNRSYNLTKLERETLFAKCGKEGNNFSPEHSDSEKDKLESKNICQS